MLRSTIFIILISITFLFSGCATPRIILFGDDSIPLKEYTLQGADKGKVLLIPVEGTISDETKREFLNSKPSMIQEIVSQLSKAEKDPAVRAVVLKIDSPGGSVTASDVLYHEILTFKERTRKKIVAAMMNVAASGGYYIALPADFILAHPTTVTGSVGVLFLQPNVTGLMEKIGVEVDVSKSGRNKDIGSPFRPSTAEEKEIIQGLIEKLGQRFLGLVARHRKLNQINLSDVGTARLYLADEAQRLGLVDKIGYLGEAITEAKKLGGLSPAAKVVVYRRTDFPDDNLYNSRITSRSGSGPTLIDIDLPVSMKNLRTGFYYLWAPGLNNQ
ncbi:MAG: signal peptide peptidase SppA [Deltaproteobacteria bacterium]|nr:MAG: signal peptide peptidase SppA [Deltaproteobacteria bacterium]